MDTAEIYVDGACRNNGHNNPQGGCGVYWGPFHPMKWSEKLQGEKQTNNRTEITVAIIALSQAVKLGIKSVQIVTDSRYVKEGITKWIREWKQNNWKTAEKSAKKKRDVLNKDMWLWLDFMRSQLQVVWMWVGGHYTNEGNLCADDLAKKGISSEGGVWQEYGGHLYSGYASMGTSEQKMGPTVDGQEEKYKCKKCGINAQTEIDRDQSIQYQNCKEWVHYECPKLPSDQLYLFETTQRRYSCEVCTSMEDDFHVQNDPNHKEEQEAETVATQQHSVDLNHKMIESHETKDDHKKIESEKNVKQSNVIDTEKNKTESNQRNVSTSADPSKINISISEELETFKKSRVDLLQESFVSSFDKINNSIREISTAQPDIEKFQKQIRKLTEENEKLKLQLNSKRNSSEEISCSKCEESIRRVETLKKELEKEKENTKQQMSNSRLEAETQESILNTEISLLQRKEESLSRFRAIQEADIVTLEKRLDVKNQLI